MCRLQKHAACHILGELAEQVSNPLKKHHARRVSKARRVRGCRGIAQNCIMIMSQNHILIDMALLHKGLS